MLFHERYICRSGKPPLRASPSNKRDEEKITWRSNNTIDIQIFLNGDRYHLLCFSTTCRILSRSSWEGFTTFVFIMKYFPLW
jgi:hypothetical protein